MKVKGLLLSILLVATGTAFAGSFYPKNILDCQQHYPPGKYFHHTKWTHGLYLPAYQYPRFGFYGRHYHRFMGYHSANTGPGFYRCYNAEGLSIECFKQ